MKLWKEESQIFHIFTYKVVSVLFYVPQKLTAKEILIVLRQFLWATKINWAEEFVILMENISSHATLYSMKIFEDV